MYHAHLKGTHYEIGFHWGSLFGKARPLYFKQPSFSNKERAKGVRFGLCSRLSKILSRNIRRNPGLGGWAAL